MAANLSAFIKYLGHSQIAIKSIVTGKSGAQEGHFQAITINKAEDYIAPRNGKRQLWINLQKLKPVIGEYIAFSDIESYKNVYIDLDCEKPDGMKNYAATEEERVKALSQLPILQAWLESRGLRCGLELHTGNGAGMVLPIPETKAEPVFIAKLSTLLKKVQADIPCTDPAMFDPPRVIGIPGTINAKLETEDRKNQVREIVGGIPEREEDQALLDFINSLEPDPATLSTYRDKYNEPQDAPHAEEGNKGQPENEPLSPDAAERLQELFSADPTFKADLTTPAPAGKRSDAEFRMCARLCEAGFNEAEIYAIMTSSQQTKWQKRGKDYRWATIRSAVAKAKATHTDAGAKHLQEMPKAKAEGHKKRPSLDEFYKQACIECGKEKAGSKEQMDAMLSIMSTYDPDEEELRAIMAGMSYAKKHGGEVDPRPYRDRLEEAEAFVAGQETAVDEPISNGQTVIDGIKALAGVCDGATSKDGAGFNKFDAKDYKDIIDKALSEGTLSLAEEKKAYRFLKKYAKQLKGLGVEYNDIGPMIREGEDAGNGLAEINDRIPQWIEEHHFKTVSDTKKIYHYEHGVYLDNGETILEALIESEFSDSTNNKMVSDIIGKVKRRTYTDRELFNNRHVLNVKNGLLDLETLQLQPHTPDYLSTAQIDVLYNPEAKAPQIAKFFQEVAQSGDIALIEEIIGWLLWPDYHIHKAVMLVGPGRNGKGTLLRLIVALLGKKSISNVTLQDLVTDAYAKSDLYGKLVNIGGDLPSKDLSDTSAFRNLTGGDDNRAQEKYRLAFSFRNKAKMLFSANVLPRSQDDTYAFYVRWILIEFLNRFILDDGTADPNLDEKLQTQEELSGLLNIALNGLKRLKANGWKFSYTKTAEDVERMYKRNANPVFAFLMDECEAGGATDYIEKSVFFDKFNAYVKKHNLRPMSTTKFGELLKDQTEIPVSTYRPWVDRGDRPMCWAGVKFKTPLTKPAKTPEKGGKPENKTANNGLQSTPSTLGSYSTNTQIENRKEEGNKGIVEIEYKQTIDGIDCDPLIAFSKVGKMVDSVEQKLDAVTQDVDGGGKEATPLSKKNQPTPKKDNPGLAKFKLDMAKHHCSVCGQMFIYDLAPYDDGKVGSYRCFGCAMKSQSAPPVKVNPQTVKEST